MPGPTLKTVAAAAGVSVATASNAYNRPDRMSPAVRTRVLAAAEQLGYSGPNPAGRSLRSGRSGTIGVLFNTRLSYAFDDPYCVELLAGVSQVVEDAGSGLSLLPLPPLGAGEDDLERAVSAVRSAVVDGVIADGISTDHPVIRLLRARQVPVVQSVDSPEAARVVTIDDFEAARGIGRHLADQGHHHVAVLLDEIDGPEKLLGAVTFPYGRLRLAGLQDGFGGEVTTVAVGGNTAEQGRAAAARVLAEGGAFAEGRAPAEARTTAIAAVTDVLALGVLHAVREAQLRPGHDIAVTGFDDLPGTADAGLTTVHQPIREKGRLMARMLLEPTFLERRILLPTELRVRSSSLR